VLPDLRRRQEAPGLVVGFLSEDCRLACAFPALPARGWTAGDAPVTSDEGTHLTHDRSRAPNLEHTQPIAIARRRPGGEMAALHQDFPARLRCMSFGLLRNHQLRENVPEFPHYDFREALSSHSPHPRSIDAKHASGLACARGLFRFRCCRLPSAGPRCAKRRYVNTFLRLVVLGHTREAHTPAMA
jgi:hypothetical protein